jgi:hypothetical protein
MKGGIHIVNTKVRTTHNYYLYLYISMLLGLIVYHSVPLHNVISPVYIYQPGVRKGGCMVWGYDVIYWSVGMATQTVAALCYPNFLPYPL